MIEGENQLRIEFNQLHERRLYFLLTASGTSIGFAVTQIDKVTESPAICVLAASILLLGFSFVSGAMSLSIESKLIGTNVNYLRSAPRVVADGRDPKAFQELVKKKSFEPLQKKLSFWRAAQIWTLFSGGLLLPIWKLWMCEPCVRSFANMFK